MEIETYVRFLAALVLVLGLIGACAWAARRFGFGGSLPITRGAAARLSVVEVKVLDSRRKLVLLRRDAAEHLILLGPNQDFLIERIEAPAPVEAGARKSPKAQAAAKQAEGSAT
jgi:flagellar protein FliO/FliZ